MGNWLRSSFGELLFRALDFSSGEVGNKLTKKKKKEGVGVKQSMMGCVDTSSL